MATVSSKIPKQDLRTTDIFVMINGLNVAAKYGVVSFTVSKAVNRISTATLELFDGDAAKGKFELSSSPDFLPGTEVSVMIGIEHIPSVLFKGIIIKHGIKAPAEGQSLLRLELKHKAVKMTINRKNKYFADKTDSQIIQSILSENSVIGNAESTTAIHKEMVQYYCTDWDFIVSRADVNGQLVFVDDEKISIKRPAADAAVANIVYGTNVVEFSAEMDARDQYGKVTGRTWDYSKQEVVEKSSNEQSPLKEQGNFSGTQLSDVLGIDDYLLQNPAWIQNEELQAWSNSKFIRSRMSKIKGKIRIHGSAGIKPGDLVNLSGFGDRFNGDAFVSGIVHSYLPGSIWFTDIQIGYSQDWFSELHDNIIDTPSAGLVPASQGLMTGVVTDIVDEEGGEFRVRVRIPVIDKGNKGVWARIVSADAGPSRGILIRPEVDDEVIVGFVNNDPRDPVILGMVYSKKNKVFDDFKPTKENKIKGWLTISKIKITIDDAKKIVTIETPGKNSIVLDDDKKSITLTDDKNKNKIIMDDKGITLDAQKDIILTAKGKVTITGTKDVTAESKSGKLVAKGSTGAEVSSSGQSIFKGSIVKIN